MRREHPERVLRDVGRRIAEARADHGWTQEEFAERLGVNTRYLARLERGAQNFTVRTLVGLAAALGVRTADLFAAPRSRAVRVGRPPRTPSETEGPASPPTARKDGRRPTR